GTIIGAFITGVSLDNTYLVLSLFLAFATLFPDFTFMIFFVIPVKVKYLGYLSAAMYLFTLITGSNDVRVAILVALINYFLFFGKELVMGRKNATKARIRKKSYQTNMSPKREHQHQHQCEICGKTDQQDFNLEFRRCSKCDGQHEYCMEHLFTHEHVKK
ncbi:MAG: hypothetical protein H7X94_03835, partial [Vallitaleaceae bacterium]|nr:hypothetical protein [Vallitaleaceae bacterium]